MHYKMSNFDITQTQRLKCVNIRILNGEVTKIHISDCYLGCVI